MYIYLLTSPSGKHYVGLTTRDVDLRFEEHINEWRRGKFKRKLFGAFTKYDPSNFKKEIIYEAASIEELCSKEMEYIKQYDSYHNGYNMTLGGEGFRFEELSAEHKQSLSEARTEYWYTEKGQEWKKQLSKKMIGNDYGKNNKGWNPSEETRKRMSEARKGKESTFKGKHHTKEFKEKMSRDRVGRHWYWNPDTGEQKQCFEGYQPLGWIQGYNPDKRNFGWKQSKKQKAIVTKLMSKKWIVTHPNGHREEIFNLNAFCREHGVSASNVSRGGQAGYKAIKI